jgi:energy-coupling factor transport system ATP-binding protein
MWQIELIECSYSYQPGSSAARLALRGVSLGVAPGELTALIGAGGAGKSTLLLLLAGLVAPQGGELRLAGKKASGKAVFRQVGLCFQYPEQQLFAETVFDEVAFGARNFELREPLLTATVREALTTVGLDPDSFGPRSPFALSGGEKRRVCIASLLAIDPPLLIFDEPAAGLDEQGRAWMRQLLLELNQRGKTVLWVTHDMDEVAELAQRVLVLEQGRLILDGSPAAVFAEQQRLRQAGLDIPEAAALVRGLKAQGLNLPGEAITVAQAAQELIACLGGERHA